MKTPDLHVQSYRYAVKYLFIFALICPPLLAALAPDSIAGKVYRDSFFSTALRRYGEATILFGSDGRFIYLKEADAFTVTQRAGSGAELRRPPGDGRYTYTRTDDTAGRIDLNYDGGSQTTITMLFTSATAGRSDRAQAFTLSDLTTLQIAPAANVSLRGRVTAGQPLIVGFVVPGTRLPEGLERSAADAVARDILIRVVGPSLTQFGIARVWADPDFQIFRDNVRAPNRQWHYPDWSTFTNRYSPDNLPVDTRPNPDGVAAFRKIFSYLGAFPLLDNSKDAADVVRLGPGAYTIVCDPANGDAGGEVLIEVYFLP